MSSNVARGGASLGARPPAPRMRSAALASLRPKSSSAPVPRGDATDRARKSPQTHTPPFAAFRSMVWKYWRENGRHKLPWRRTSDPYKILVSEVMLQQTQADRVIPKYKEFLRWFPTVRALARAPLIDVLKVWSGLGYNRRAKFLHDAAIQIVEKHRGKVPRDHESLRALSGVGDYTARAVRVFAFNEPDILIETNIRTAIIQSFFRPSPNVRGRIKLGKVTDRDVATIARRLAQRQHAREWHSALMDYGAHLKRSGVCNNHRSAHYTKQSKFEGSLRQLRGSMLKSLMGEGLNNDLRGRYSNTRVRGVLEGLKRDGLIVSHEGEWRIA
ncbi:A/G-specific adenine glycosylase [Candidatus Kaiserbacteria bacterium]|nr:A/G-specific adenine glycosylase [Candidatus Kaiserbacteria bacterium]